MDTLLIKRKIALSVYDEHFYLFFLYTPPPIKNRRLRSCLPVVGCRPQATNDDATRTLEGRTRMVFTLSLTVCYHHTTVINCTTLINDLRLNFFVRKLIRCLRNDLIACTIFL